MKLSRLVAYLDGFAIWWVIFSILWFFRDSEYRYLYLTLGLAGGLVMAFSAYFVARKKLWALWLATVFVGLTILISIFDEIGWADVIFIALSTSLFITLLKGRRLMKR